MVGERSMSVWVFEGQRIKKDILFSLGILFMKINAENHGNCAVQNNN